MSDVAEREKGYNSDSDSQQPLYDRPKGLKGLYMHPVTQVRIQVTRKLFLLTWQLGGNACIHLFYVSRYPFSSFCL